MQYVVKRAGPIGLLFLAVAAFFDFTTFATNSYSAIAVFGIAACIVAWVFAIASFKGGRKSRIVGYLLAICSSILLADFIYRLLAEHKLL